MFWLIFDDSFLKGGAQKLTDCCGIPEYSKESILEYSNSILEYICGGRTGIITI